LIAGYVQNNMSEKALDLFEEMPLKTNEVTHSIIFKACSQLKNDRGRDFGKKLLDELLNAETPNDIVLTSAIHMQMIYGDTQGAEHLFQLIKRKDAFSYGTIMNGYNLNHEPMKTFAVFEEMKQQNVVPDESILAFLIHASSRLGFISTCKSIVSEIPSDWFDNRRVCSALIDMWVSMDYLPPM
jgi:pentatricopeptide repeat protein